MANTILSRNVYSSCGKAAPTLELEGFVARKLRSEPLGGQSGRPGGR